MKRKRASFAVLAAVLLLVMSSVAKAVDTREIDKVRGKKVLDPKEDFAIIDDFVAKAVRELVRTRELASISSARTVISRCASSLEDSAEAQYAAQFFESAYKHISEGFEQASRLTGERKFIVTVNLLILIDKLLADGPEDVRLADSAIRMLKDENTVIAYWAVHSVTNPGIIKQLNSAKSNNTKLGLRIAEQFGGLIETGGPEIIALIAEFAANIEMPQGEELLLRMADMRIKRYADWTVEYELLDASILSSLYKKISSAPASKPELAGRFGQLYSYAIQRYIKGRHFLSATQRQQLASVLIGTEDDCICKLFPGYQADIKKAVGRDDYENLWLAHGKLLGDETRPGKVAQKWKYDYGENANGSGRIAPRVLPEPPKSEAGG